MSLFPASETLLIWCVLMLGALAICLGLFWRVLTIFRRAPAGAGVPADARATMTAAIEITGNAVAEQNEPRSQQALARRALETMADTAGPDEALAMVRRLMPIASPGLLHQLLANWWQESGSRPVLAAIAGLWQLAPAGQKSGLGFDLAWRDGDAPLLDYLERVVASHFDMLDRWFGTGEAIFLVEAAKRRVAAEDAALANRLVALAARIEERTRVVLLDYVRATIAWQAEPVADGEPERRPIDLARGLSFLCVPRFPELAAVAHKTFSHGRGPDWDRAALEFDRMVIEEFGVRGRLDGFDFDASEMRFYDALTAYDLGLAEDAGFMLADLIEQGYFHDWEHLLFFKQAMDWSENLHWPRPDGHVRLLEVLARTSPQDRA